MPKIDNEKISKLGVNHILLGFIEMLKDILETMGGKYVSKEIICRLWSKQNKCMFIGMLIPKIILEVLH